MVPDHKVKSEASQLEALDPALHQATKRVKYSPSPLTEETSRAQSPCRARSGELAGSNSAVRESSRLKSKAASALKTKQESQHSQQTTDQGHPMSESHKIRRKKAAEAAERMKEACTINEDELMALRPTLLKGYASLQKQTSDAALEAELKTLLYYFRCHTVEAELLKRLCFVELVYMLQSHPNRLVADLASQLITLGPWKIVYDQLRLSNAAWFKQHAIEAPPPLAGPGVAASPDVVPVAAALQKQSSGLKDLQK